MGDRRERVVLRPAASHCDLLGIDLPASGPHLTFAGFLLQEFAAIPSVGDNISVAGSRLPAGGSRSSISTAAASTRRWPRD
jgi:CBS domain containing-hemolysin-like protein